MVSSANDADLVRAAQAGDRQAFSTLFERWFDRSYDVAWRIVRNPDTAAEVAQDTFLAAYTKIDTLRDADAFGGWVLRTSRNKALNRLEREGRSMAMDTDDTVGLLDRGRSAADIADDIVRQEQMDLVWAASAALGERDASILDLHLRHDLDPSEIAEALDISPNAAHQTLFRLRKRLEGAIRSYVLWHDGQPECGELADVLEAATITSFGPSAVKAISTHVATCDACDERHATILAPASMFAAVPLVVLGSGVREAAAAALVGQGVPLDLDLIASAATSGGEPHAVHVGGEDSKGLWQINVESRRRLAVIGGIAAMLVLVAAVVGAGVLDDGGDTEQIAAVAIDATDTTESPSTSSSTSSSSTSSSTTEADEVASDTTTPDAPPSSAEPPLVTNPSVPSTTARPTTTASTTTSTTSTSTTSTTSTTTPPPMPPAIGQFSIAETGAGVCGRTSGRLYTLRWTTTDADSVSITGPNVEPGTKPLSGSTGTCLPFGQEGTWTLTATGPGGFATQTVSAGR